jgi:trimethylamine-N-oxide reductase (cytochrome c)
MLLFGLMVLIKRGARKYPALKEKIKEKDFSILIKTEDGRRGRHFAFSKGAVTSGGGGLPNADISLIWKDADTGFRVMIRQSDKAFVKAIQNGSLKIQGDPNCIPAFMSIVRGSMKGMR